MIMKSLQSLKPLTNFCPIFGIAAKLFQLNFNDDKVPPSFHLIKKSLQARIDLAPDREIKESIWVIYHVGEGRMTKSAIKSFAEH